MNHAIEDAAGLVAIVTGGASGIGAGICEVLAKAGMTVIIADNNFDKAEAQAAAIRTSGGNAAAISVDLADEASVIRSCAAMIEQHGVPWALINNAGLQNRQILLEGTVDFWDRMMVVNSRGPFLLSREVARAMVTAGRGGRIVNIASTALIGQMVKGHAAYASSKAALDGLTRASALELAPHGITVNMVMPGGVMTPGSMGAEGPAPEGPAKRYPPLGMCEPRDIGAAVLFFASPAARYVTNQRLAVDAGWSTT